MQDPPVPSSPLEASLTCFNSILSLVSEKAHSINQGRFLNHSLQGLRSVHFVDSVLKMNFYESLLFCEFETFHNLNTTSK